MGAADRTNEVARKQHSPLLTLAALAAPSSSPSTRASPTSQARAWVRGSSSATWPSPKDRELVCRHLQCNIAPITIPELNAKCTKPFAPATADGEDASATCCTSDITLEEYKTLCGTMEGSNPDAETPGEFIQGTPRWQTDLYAECGTAITLRKHIELTDELGLLFIAELKTPEMEMLTRATTPSRSSRRTWSRRSRARGSPRRGCTSSPSCTTTFCTCSKRSRKRRRRRAHRCAPLQYLVTLSEDNEIIPSMYAVKAKELGLDIISWSLKWPGFLSNGGGYYYSTIANVINNDGDVYSLLHVLVQDVGVLGVFTDWSATVTYYANCSGIF